MRYFWRVYYSLKRKPRTKSEALIKMARTQGLRYSVIKGHKQMFGDLRGKAGGYLVPLEEEK